MMRWGVKDGRAPCRLWGVGGDEWRLTMVTPFAEPARPSCGDRNAAERPDEIHDLIAS